jgi:sugar lactone lactonase YvrE
MTFFRGAAWVGGSGKVARIDPATNQVTSSVRIDAGTPDGLVSVGDTLWVANEEGPVLTPIDASGRAGVPEVVADEPRIRANQLVVEANGKLWLPLLGEDRVVVVDV